VQAGDDCACHFNNLHIVWLVAVPLILIALIVVGVWYYRKKKEEQLYSRAAGYNQMKDEAA